MVEWIRKHITHSEEILEEVKERSLKLLAAKSFMYFLVSLGIFFIYFWFYVSVLHMELPKTTILRRRNAEWLSKMELVNAKMDAYEESLKELETIDEDVYRSIFGMNSLSPTKRNESFRGISFYNSLDGCDNSGLLKKTMMRQDVLTKKAYVQTMSFDDVSYIAHKAGDMAACLPAIPPMIPDGSKYRRSSPFGYRVDPHYRSLRMHTGYDFSMKPGNRVFATGDGVVEAAEFEFYGYGNCVTIDHGFGYKTRYAHLKVINVVKGMKVKRGELIGESGNSGKSTGPHLHYEVLYRNKYVNPLNYMDLDMPVEEYRQMVEQVSRETGHELVLPMHKVAKKSKSRSKSKK